MPSSASALAQRTFEPRHPSAAQIARLAGTLPSGGGQRLERLRGFGAPIGGTLLCFCSRLTLADNSHAILVVATERAGKDLSLPERARRLLADIARPAAVFSADGELIEVQPAARAQLSGRHDLNALGADRLAREASLNGHAEGVIATGPITMLRLGAGATVTLLVAMTPQIPAAAAPEITPEQAPVCPPPAMFDTAPASHAEPASDTARNTAARTAADDAAARRIPFRFVWQMDADTRFSHGLENFAIVVGPKTAATPHNSWAELANTLQLDSAGHIARALAAHQTWSGIAVPWPVDGSDARVTIEMSALPVFDRDRQFVGYRGFAICRDVEQLAARLRQPAVTATPVAPPPVPPAPVIASVEPPPTIQDVPAQDVSVQDSSVQDLPVQDTAPPAARTAAASQCAGVPAAGAGAVTQPERAQRLRGTGPRTQ